MNTNDKTRISDLLKEELAYVSQTKLANKIGDISSGTISQIVNLKWMEQAQLISDKMWNRLANYLNYQREWVIVETDRNTKKVLRICESAQGRGVARSIIGDPGLSKSASLKLYAKHNVENTFYIECANYFTKKEFLHQLRKSMGMSGDVTSITDLIKGVVARLRELRRPLIIIDEMDKLRDDVLSVVLALYNASEGRTGWIMCGSLYLDKRFEKGVRLKKQSYRELFSRVGGQFEVLYDLDQSRVGAICIANGITNEQHILRVWNSSANDLRRVKNVIERIRIEIEKDRLHEAA